MRLLTGTLLVLLAVLPAHAQVLNYDQIFKSPTLTGDWGGLRGTLEDRGFQLGGDEILETLGNTDGGKKRGAVVEGRFELFANVDLEEAFGWQGALLHANAYQIHGQGLSADNLGNLLTVSNIEARPATRLFSLWIQQSLFNDALSLRAGQIAADDEFFVSQYAALFINSTFGWPAILGINLPGGGPAYSAARPGLRARIATSPRLTLSAAIFSGEAHTDKSGFDFHFNGDVFSIGELAYGITAFALPGTIKLGSWFHSGPFSDQRYDATHLSLADPASSGVAARHRGDYGGYVVFDQLLWRRDGTSDAGLGAFLRAGGNPGDRNLVEFHFDGGLIWTAPFGRDSDTLGIGISDEQVSAAQRGLTLDFDRLRGTALPEPDFESALEASYQAQMAPWWIVQPDLQWIIHPGARLLNLSGPLTARSAGALVLGLRTAIAL